MSNLKSSRGEIVTALTIVGVIFLSIITFVSNRFLFQNKITSSSSAASCAVITSVNDPGPLSSGQDFTCSGTLDPAFSGSTNIACGWSKNNGWPQTGGRWDNPTCNGVNCSFGIRMDSFSNSTTDSYTLVMFDMTSSCGPSTGKSIPLTLSGINQPTATTTTTSPPTCDSGKLDKSGNCNPACCDNNSQCPSGQYCVISNGTCRSNFSCGVSSTVNPTNNPNPTATNSPSLPTPTTFVCKSTSGIKDLLTKLFNFENQCITPTISPSNNNCQPPGVCATSAYLQCSGVWGVCQEGQSSTYPSCTSSCYSIDYRNSAIQPKDKQNIVRYVDAAWPGNRMSANYDYVYNWAINNNWNPAFLMAIWIEESGGGSVSQFDFGCGAPSLNQYKGIDGQFACLTNAISSYNTKAWPVFDCMYSEGHYPCQFTINPYFNANLKRVYNNVINGF